MAEILWRGENDHLDVTIYDDASASLMDKASGERWVMGRVALQEDNVVDVGHAWLRTTRSTNEQYPGRFKGEVLPAGGLRFTLFGREGRVMGAFMCQVQLEEHWIIFRLSDIEQSIPSLVFPTPIVSQSLVFPRGIGQWVRQPIPDRNWWLYPVHINMRWFGGLRGNHGWLCVLEDGHADGGVMATELAAAPAYMQSMGQWTPRSVRYCFTQGGYVALAKAYRAYAKQQGLFRSLEEKIAANPSLKNLLGGRLVSFWQAETRRPERYEDRLKPVPDGLQEGVNVKVTHADAIRLLDDLRADGMKRGLVVLRGWINGGYDEAHPDVWPPEPALGPVDELRALLAVPDPIVVGLHDNYQDIYQQSPSWPKGILINRGGERVPAGFWAGGQAYLINSRDGLAYARRNWEQIKTLNPRAFFPDTTTCNQFYESYEPGNEATRTQDEQYKTELLQFFKAQGLLVGSEEVSDFGAPHVDWYENRHRRAPDGQTIPLWPLVYHDGVICASMGSGNGSPVGPGLNSERWAAQMLWGYMLMWDVRDQGDWARLYRSRFAASGHVDEWHARIGLDEMLSHRFLTEDYALEETVFSSGAAIIANFADEARSAEGLTVRAGQTLIRS